MNDLVRELHAICRPKDGDLPFVQELKAILREGLPVLLDPPELKLVDPPDAA